MKAIILERKDGIAAALCEDGTVVKTRQSGEVGETIELKAETAAFPAKKKNRWLRSAVAAVLALVLMGGGTFGYLTTTASAYVSLDVEDSSVELTVNHLGRVIEVRAVDDDSEELAEQLRGEVRHKKVEDALDRTMEHLHKKHHSGGKGRPVIAGVASDDERRKETLTKAVEESAERAGEDAVYVSKASRAEREQAMEQHQSVGRYAYEHHGSSSTHQEPPHSDGNPPPPKP